MGRTLTRFSTTAHRERQQRGRAIDRADCAQPQERTLHQIDHLLPWTAPRRPSSRPWPENNAYATGKTPRICGVPERSRRAQIHQAGHKSPPLVPAGRTTSTIGALLGVASRRPPSGTFRAVERERRRLHASSQGAARGFNRYELCRCYWDRSSSGVLWPLSIAAAQTESCRTGQD